MAAKKGALLIPVGILLAVLAVGPAVVEATCEDVVTNCKEYSSFLCKSNPFWAKKNCLQTCGMCNVCPEGWSLYKEEDTCIKVFGLDSPISQVEWSKAKTICEQNGGHLVVTKTSFKNLFVLSLLGSSFDFWIGLYNASPGKGFDFKYVDGSALGTYHPWVGNNPDNYNNKEKCVSMFSHRKKAEEQGRWNDFVCDHFLPFVCERNSK